MFVLIEFDVDKAVWNISSAVSVFPVDKSWPAFLTFTS